jgi:hypothetical protein
LYTLLLSASGAAAAQDAPAPAPAEVSFHFVRPGLPVPEYTLTVREDGSGTYAATYNGATVDSKYGNYNPVQAVAPTKITRPVALSAQTTRQLFDHVRSTGNFRGGCESRAKNIADTGTKTIRYAGPDATVDCTYNFTENKAVAALTVTFQGIAQTLDEGRDIDLKHRYDRLGLDHALAQLADEVHDGRAIELATIAPVLQSLCNDSQVMERVRKRAAGLLEASQIGR